MESTYMQVGLALGWLVEVDLADSSNWTGGHVDDGATQH